MRAYKCGEECGQCDRCSRVSRRHFLKQLAGGLALCGLGTLASACAPLALSSFLLWVVFPRGYYAARTLWVTVHKWGGLALSVAAVVHLILHWKWLARQTRRIFKA